ncbi:MAG: SRPBCC family protein [Deltaproteobacteria bacterium]|nr:SRPBCC family protein [Deltaproteobacteria bacterium]
MTTLRHQTRIEAPITLVWQAVAGDLTAVQRYNPMVSSARLLTDTQEGVGASRRCELKPRGFVEERVWEWTPLKAIGLEVVASGWPIVFMKWRTELAADGAATVVTQQMNYRLKFGPLGFLMDALMMRRKLDSGIRDIFENLKRYVESGGVQSVDGRTSPRPSRS